VTTVYLCPLSTFTQLFNDSGSALLPGALIWTYVAGTSTPTGTYTDETGTVLNSNPIQLGSNARLNNINIWQPQGVSLKVLFSTNAGTVGSPVFGSQIGPVFDQIIGINDPTALQAVLANPASGSGVDTIANAMRSYDLVASVRSANAPSLAGGQTLVIDVQAASSPGDGLGGLFYWNASSSATDDGVTVIKPNSVSGNGRYLRQSQVSVLAFTANLTGMTTTIQGTLSYYKTASNQVFVILQSAAITGTSNSTGFNINNWPSAIQPSAQRIVPCILEDNGIVIGGWASLSGATMTFGTGINNNSAGFTNSGFKGLPLGFEVAYQI